jgi:hypothetical protein
LGALSDPSTVAASYVAAQTAGAVEALGGIRLSLAVNLLLFFIAFRLCCFRAWLLHKPQARSIEPF